MIARQKRNGDKRKFESIFLVYAIVAASVVLLIPMTTPQVQAQVGHDLGSAQAEDGHPLYDADGVKNNVVLWDVNLDHWITTNYTVEEGYTLDIPAFDFSGDPIAGKEITFKNGAQRIDVYGTLLTHENSIMPPKWTAFMGDSGATWTGIWFRPGSFGNIRDCGFTDATKGVRFFPAVPMAGLPASTMLSPGIYRSTFSDMGSYGVQLYGAVGYTNVELCSFTDTKDSAKGMEIYDQNMNLIDCTFSSHGVDKPQLDILNSNVIASGNNFMGATKPGSLVKIEGASDSCVFESCVFDNGNSGDYYVQVLGSLARFDNCTFVTSGGALSVTAREDGFGAPASPIIRQPTSDYSPGPWDNTFDNTTLNVTGASIVTLQWFMDVYVEDPIGNPIDNAPVWVVNRTDDPAEPSSKTTDSGGWARWFTVTELIMYNSTIEYFSQFNVSSLNNSMMGYAFPEPQMDMSKDVTVVVPFNPTPNTPPIITYLPTPSGVQTGLVTIDFTLEDPDSPDDGNLSVYVEFSTDGSFWSPATAGPGSEYEYLSSNTMYQFIWDSSHIDDLISQYSSTVYIRITPSDRAGAGPQNQTGTFTVDNEAPFLMSMPVVITTNETAIINWTVHENADATVWYGLNPDYTQEASGSSGSTIQSVTLTGLQPGRNYTYAINSTDSVGNKFTSYGKFQLTFVTKIYIQLYEGWNMISLAPNTIETNVDFQLSSIADQFDAVQIYDASDTNDPWKDYIPGKLFGNDLTDLYPDFGIWIKMKNDAILIVNHEIPDPIDTPYDINLVKGWNFVGYPSVTTRSVDSTLSGVDYDMVQTYDAASGQWYSYDGASGDLAVVECGRGYWIHCTNPSGDTWSPTYA